MAKLNYIKRQRHYLIIVIKRRTGPTEQSQSLNLISFYIRADNAIQHYYAQVGVPYI